MSPRPCAAMAPTHTPWSSQGLRGPHARPNSARSQKPDRYAGERLSATNPQRRRRWWRRTNQGRQRSDRWCRRLRCFRWRERRGLRQCRHRQSSWQPAVKDRRRAWSEAPRRCLGATNHRRRLRANGGRCGSKGRPALSNADADNARAASARSRAIPSLPAAPPGLLAPSERACEPVARQVKSLIGRMALPGGSRPRSTGRGAVPAIGFGVPGRCATLRWRFAPFRPQVKPA
jgi:hypothetical protein